MNRLLFQNAEETVKTGQISGKIIADKSPIELQYSNLVSSLCQNTFCFHIFRLLCEFIVSYCQLKYCDCGQMCQYNLRISHNSDPIDTICNNYWCKFSKREVAKNKKSVEMVFNGSGRYIADCENILFYKILHGMFIYGKVRGGRLFRKLHFY